MKGVNADEKKKKPTCCILNSSAVNTKSLGPLLAQQQHLALCLVSLSPSPTICGKHSVQCHMCCFGSINNIILDSDANDWGIMSYLFWVARGLEIRWESMQTHSWDCQAFITRHNLEQMYLQGHAISYVWPHKAVMSLSPKSWVKIKLEIQINQEGISSQIILFIYSPSDE